MLLSRKTLGRALPMVLLCATLASCSSELQTIYRTPPAKYEKLGQVTGTASGSLGAISTAYYVIPMGLNSRVERAYVDAITKIPGTTGLIDITYQESWYWWLIGTARQVTITGEAIKEVQ